VERVDPMSRKLTRPPDEIEILDEEEIIGLCSYRTPPEKSRRQGRHQRSELNAARSSAANSSGSSQAAKWPPLSTSLK
jgi:hypothetical protein